MLYYVLNTLIGIVVAIALANLLFALFARRQGDADWKVVFVGQRPRRSAGMRGLRWEPEWELVTAQSKQVTLRTQAVLRNVGREQGTVMDCFARAYLPQEQCAGVRADVLVMAEDALRYDNYWEARLVPAKTNVSLRIELTLMLTGEPAPAWESIPEIPVDLFYQVYGRSDYTYEKTRFYCLPAERERALVAKGAMAK